MAKANATRTLIVAVGARLPLVVVLLAAGWLLRRGLSEGALLGTLTYLVQGLGPAVASVVGGIGAPLAQLLVVADRLETVGSPPSEPAAQPAGAALKLHNVTFRYRRAAEPVINRLDLEIEPGDHLAVVGPSGVGKSTLASLLVGALVPQEGTIRHGGRAPTEVAAAARALIPQEAYVFRGTVDENIRYLHPTAGGRQRDDAIAAVCGDDLVRRLGGVDADLDPSRLSAGERQLLALARAYLAAAPLVILDEATCHLDPPAEAAVEAAFRHRPGTTLVVVAHRLSSARRADRVLLMDGPEVVVGTHDDLVERSPAYRELVGHWLDPVDW
jgi:ATP-binding cassette subfamily C protein